MGRLYPGNPSEKRTLALRSSSIFSANSIAVGLCSYGAAGSSTADAADVALVEAERERAVDAEVVREVAVVAVVRDEAEVVEDERDIGLRGRCDATGSENDAVRRLAAGFFRPAVSLSIDSLHEGERATLARSEVVRADLLGFFVGEANCCDGFLCKLVL